MRGSLIWSGPLNDYRLIEAYGRKQRCHSSIQIIRKFVKCQNVANKLIKWCIVV